jgi:hypothetical protein
LRRAGVASSAYLSNEVLYLGIHVAVFAVAIAVTVWAMR